MMESPLMIKNSIVLLLLAGAFSLSGCASGGKLGAGEKLYQLGEYDKAASSFKKAYSREKNRFYKARASYFLGRSYLNLNQGRRAATALDRAVRNGYSEPDVYLHLGQALRLVQEYEEAIAAYEKYLEYDVGNVVANNGIASCRLAMGEPRPTRYRVEEVKGLNSRYSDFSPAFEGSDFSTLYFSSMRKAGKKKKNTSRITGQGSSMVYFSRQKGEGTWDDPQPFTGDVSVNEEDGTPSFSGDGKELYFTRCAYLEEGPSGAAIWTMKKMGGRWGNPEKLEMGPDSLIFAHPAISPDGKALFFVSDMPGGYGGTDIWKVNYKAGGSWGVPVNLGPLVNTPGDEMFPYVRSNGRLYFSSNGLVGYGGLDIFEAVPTDDDGWAVRNMGVPVNSSSDDFGIVFMDEREAGYFSSSRNSSNGIDNLFAFERPLIIPTLSGKVQDTDGEPIQGATLRIVGNNGTNARISSQAQGIFQLTLQPDADYVIMASAPGFLNKKEQVSTRNMIESKTFERNLVLESARSAVLFYDIRFNPGETGVHPQARENLDRVARILTANPDYRINIEVHAFGGNSENDDLVTAQKRAESVEAFLLEKGVSENQLLLHAVGRSHALRADEALATKFDFLTVGQSLNSEFLASLSAVHRRSLLGEINRIHFSLAD